MGRVHAIAAVAACLAGALVVTTRAAEAEEPACTCRGPGGARVELGGTSCLPSPTGPRLARCVMDVNILSWQFLETPCVVSFTPLPEGWRHLAGLASPQRPAGSP
jgi:hypothetical protein